MWAIENYEQRKASWVAQFIAMWAIENSWTSSATATAGFIAMWAIENEANCVQRTPHTNFHATLHTTANKIYEVRL